MVGRLGEASIATPGPSDLLFSVLILLIFGGNSGIRRRVCLESFSILGLSDGDDRGGGEGLHLEVEVSLAQMDPRSGQCLGGLGKSSKAPGFPFGETCASVVRQ